MMRFCVNFMTGESAKPLVASMGEPGLDMLDLVREKHPELKNIAAEEIEIYSGCPINGSTLNQTLTEEQARQTKLFNGRTTVDVHVQEHAFSKYVDSELSPKYTDEIVKFAPSLGGFQLGNHKTKKRLYGAAIMSTFDIESMLADWQAAGFPTNWVEEK